MKNKKYYKEKHLLATEYKIENVIREQNFLVKNKWKVIAFGIVFSIWAPSYSPEGTFGQERDSLVEKGEYSYLELTLICAIIYVILCVLYHFSSLYQDRRKLKELNALKVKLEKEILELDS